MNKMLNLIMIASMLLSVIPADMVMAADESPEIKAGLMSFADEFGEMGSFEELGLPIPLTGVTPGEVMGMDHLFKDVFNHIGSDLTVSPAPPFDQDGTTIDILTITATPAGSLTNVMVVLHAIKTASLPITYSNNPEEVPNPPESGTCLDYIDNDGDGLTDGEEPDCAPITIEGNGVLKDVSFQVDASFNFQYDSSNINPLENFYLTSEPIITLGYSFNGQVQPFQSRIGIADVEVTGNAFYNGRIEIQMADEDQDGKITLSDINNTILADLYQVNYLNRSDHDVHLNLSLHSPLLNSVEDGSLELIIPDLSVIPLPAPAFNIAEGGALVSFKTIGPDELLTGLASYAYALDTAWIVNEGDLPFLAEKYHHFFTPGAGLLKLVRRQGDALVLCGTEQTAPPTGTPDPIATQTIYCQAITAEEPTNVIEWRLSGGPAPDYIGAIEDTVGMNPTAWVVFTGLTGEVWKNIEVEFQYTVEGELENHVAEPRIRTVGELEEKLAALPGVSVNQVSFDDSTRALVFDIQQVVDPEAGSIHMAFGDLLLEQAGLSNIADNSTATGKAMDIGPVTVRAGFGTILAADLSDINTQGNRTFISLNSLAPEMSVASLDISIPAGFTLPGLIGALGVVVEIDEFSITAANPLEIDLRASQEEFTNLLQAVGTRELIGNPVALVDASSDLGIDATLQVTSRGLTPPVVGTVTIDWPDFSDPGSMAVTLNATAAQLKSFNLDPENPQALVSLILDSIYNRTSQMYNQDKAGEPLPVVGLSTRELAPQFTEVIEVVNAIKTGGAAADIHCEVIEVGIGEDTQVQVQCWAVSDPSPASVLWEISPNIASSVENLEDPDTIWPDPETNGKKAIFVISETATAAQLDQMAVTLTVDGTQVEFPYHPPATLEQLEAALEQRLGLGDEGVKFSLDIFAGNALQVVIEKENQQSMGFQLQLSVQDSLGGIYRLSAQESELQAEVFSEFRLDFNLPLAASVLMENLTFNTNSSVVAEVEVNQNDFDLVASLGGLKLGLGNQAVTTAGSRPELVLTVDSMTASYSLEGEAISVTYVITNTGNFTLSGPFDVVAGLLSVNCGDATVLLSYEDDLDTAAAENKLTCTATYQTTAQDVSSPAVSTTAHAEARFGNVTLISPTVEVSVPNATWAAIGLSMSVTPEIFTAEGETLTFSYIITNTGNLPLAGPFNITDGTGLIGALCGVGPLDPGGTAHCSATYTTTAQDVSAQKVANTATVSMSGSTLTAVAGLNVLMTANPALALTVNVNAGTVMVGEALAYSYEIENNGNVTLNGPFTVSDKMTVDCSAAPAVLAPGASTSCNAGYTVTAGDLAVGEVLSEAQAAASYVGLPVQSVIVETHLVVTDVSGQSGLQVGLSSTLQYNGTGWVRTLAGTVAGDDNDVQINLGVRIIRGAEEEFVGLLGHPKDVSGGSVSPELIPADMEAKLNLAPLDPSLVSLSLPLLGELLQDSLDGDRWGIRVPLSGSDLAAGEDFAGLLAAWAGNLDTELETLSAASPKDLHDALQSAVEDAFGKSDSGNLVNVFCGGAADCNADEDSTHMVNRVEILLEVVKDNPVKAIPFETGLPGVALEVTDDTPVLSDTRWTLNLVFGLDRLYGPYVGVNDNNDLILDADMTIADPNPASSCESLNVYSKITENFDPSQERCMNAIIGLLPGTLYDGAGILDTDSPSRVSLTTNFNLAAGADTPGMLTYADLLDGLGATLPPVVSATDGNSGPARVNLLFVTDSEPIPLPQIAGTIHITYAGEYEMSYENVYLNATTFFGGFLGPLVQDVQKYTRPLQPVVDTVTAPIPVVSDLAEMVGAGSVSLLTVLQSVSRNDLSLLTRLAALITFINDIPADSSGLWIGLGEETANPSDDEPGSFSIEIELADEPPCGDDWDNFISDCERETISEEELLKLASRGNKSGKLSAEKEWTGAGISLPIFEDTGQIYGMLLGVDATLIRVDLGTLKASAGLEYTYGPFMIGPIPVSLTIGGTVTFEGRFAIGYDTRGLHQALRGNAFTGAELLQGIYIDDLDTDGNDVPEIKLEVEIFAGAAVSIRIFEAGIRAGVLFGIELNWNDPNKDGKLRFEEISMWRWKPICLFDRRGYIGFYLKFYLKIDLFLFTAKIEWTPLRMTFDLFNESCAPPSPVLAQDVGNNRYRLNMGPYENFRHIPSEEGGHEKFIVRQLTPEGDGCDDGPAAGCDEGVGTWISVTFQGIYQEFLVPKGDPKGYRIYAEAGTGDDEISLLSGTDQREETRGQEVPFTLAAELYGDSGNDSFNTGAGNDYLDGGSGSDDLNARSGDDILISGSGDASGDNNSLDGGKGTDVLIGGAGMDGLNGGPGGDVLIGGPGDDNLAGGPGMPPSSAVEEAIQDLTDVLVGSEGNDLLDGSFDTDYLFGDAPLDSLLPPGFLESINNYLATGMIIMSNADVVLAAISAAALMDCDAATGGSGDDNLIGGDGDDDLYGGGGNDRMEGEKGNDTLCGNDDHDTLTGGKGEDLLYGGSGHDWLQGDQGDDQLYGGLDDDDLLGGEGSDALYGEEGNDILIGDMGTMEDHPQVCEEGEGEDCLKIPADHPTDTSQAPAFVTLSAEVLESSNITYADTMYGGTGNDFLFGEFGNDTIYGDDGDDYLDGNAGDDTMDGGPGIDHLLGGQTEDTMSGGPGDDHMWGNSGDDRMVGNDGNDELYGNAGDDYLEGNTGMDTIHGGVGRDDIMGGSSTAGSLDVGDKLFGDEDDDRIAGDNARMTSDGVLLLDIETLPGGIDPAWYGADQIEGNDGDDQLWGQGGPDQIVGGVGDDYIEGNHDSDELYGDDYEAVPDCADLDGVGGDDDILGGSSPLFNGQLILAIDQSVKIRLVPLGQEMNVEIPLGDTICGGPGSDVILGDNGKIERPSGKARQSYLLEADTLGNAAPRHITGGGGARVMRTVEMVNSESGFTAGSDLIYGGPGEDEIYGQFDDTQNTSPAIGDEIYGNDGQDLLIGDQGVAVARVLQGETRIIKTNAPFLADNILLKGTLYWEVSLAQSEKDGNDRLSGGSGADFLHGGEGYDLMNGNAGNDRLFGDDGNDALWGGSNHDHLYGGHGEDALDVLPRPAKTATKGNREGYPADPVEWGVWSTSESFEDFDYIYGGWGQDAMQADRAPTGKAPGDRLIDWLGVYNVYYLCGAQYGEYVITRSPSPSVVDFLIQLAAGDGAFDPGKQGSSGFYELALVLKGDYSQNSHPVHTDTPGHFVCPMSIPGAGGRQ